MNSVGNLLMMVVMTLTRKIPDPVTSPILGFIKHIIMTLKLFNALNSYSFLLIHFYTLTSLVFHYYYFLVEIVDTMSSARRQLLPSNAIKLGL